MTIDSINKAAFIDRDGVINKNVYYYDTSAWESPRSADAFELTKFAIPALKMLQDAGYLLFLISNQPNAAKKKTTKATLDLIHERLSEELQAANVNFAEYYYCYHHPEAIDPKYLKNCECRKPGVKFVEQAKAQYKIDLAKSWIIGDRDTDIECGLKSGLNTIKISLKKGCRNSLADFECNLLMDAAEHIIKSHNAKKLV